MLFEPLTTTSIQLANRTVMAPMTRCRAVDANTPNALMAEYYGQRASAGLIITEGTSPSPNGLGYARIPGLLNDAQMRAWKRVTDAVHAKGGKIFVQLMPMDSYMGAPPVPAEFKPQLRAAFEGLFILAGDFDRTSAEDALKAGDADLIAFARSFLANPDLVERMRMNETLNAVDMATFYTPGPKGYTDHPSRAA